MDNLLHPSSEGHKLMSMCMLKNIKKILGDGEYVTPPGFAPPLVDRYTDEVESEMDPAAGNPTSEERTVDGFICLNQHFSAPSQASGDPRDNCHKACDKEKRCSSYVFSEYAKKDQCKLYSSCFASVGKPSQQLVYKGKIPEDVERLRDQLKFTRANPAAAELLGHCSYTAKCPGLVPAEAAGGLCQKAKKNCENWCAGLWCEGSPMLPPSAEI